MDGSFEEGVKFWERMATCGVLTLALFVGAALGFIGYWTGVAVEQSGGPPDPSVCASLSEVESAYFQLVPIELIAQDQAFQRWLNDYRRDCWESLQGEE